MKSSGSTLRLETGASSLSTYLHHVGLLLRQRLQLQFDFD